MTTTVFVSSTCFDLVDVRSEVYEHLRGIGLNVLMSDEPHSEFSVVPTLDSISTCLVNVRAADVFICILSQRYGPLLGEKNFPNISATHLEYDVARE